MLVLSRKVGERIFIGEDVVVTVVRLSSGAVRLGIDAPADWTIVRQEVEPHEKPVADATGPLSRTA